MCALEALTAVSAHGVDLQLGTCAALSTSFSQIWEGARGAKENGSFSEVYENGDKDEKCFACPLGHHLNPNT